MNTIKVTKKAEIEARKIDRRRVDLLNLQMLIQEYEEKAEEYLKAQKARKKAN
jgi:hypothetical protein